MSGILPDLPDHLAMNVFDAFQIPYSAAAPAMRSRPVLT